jgi:hypothetical protein
LSVVSEKTSATPKDKVRCTRDRLMFRARLLF